MVSTRLQAGLSGLVLATMLQKVMATPSVPIVYCASLNTASTGANSSIYQSDGLCHDFCVDKYAYAIVQEQNCWCSDYTPDKGVQVDTDKCSQSCPGYPSDLCGGDGVFGYMKLEKAAVGTKGAQSSSSSKTTSTKATTSSTSPKTTSSTPETTSTPPPSSTEPTSTPPTTSSSTSTTPTTSRSSTEQTTSSLPTTLLVQTVTAGGTVQTVTVTPASASSTEDAKSTKHKGLSTGGAVGIAIGVIVGAVAALVVAFLLWRRKRKQRETEEALFAANSTSPSSPRGSSPGASQSGKIMEVSTTPAFARRNGEGSWDESGRRRSALMPIDPRIDPGFSDIYTRSDNKSRDSINSLRDDHDYSRRVHQPNRVLRAMNPDPDDD